jgi:hypothetical protein
MVEAAELSGTLTLGVKGSYQDMAWRVIEGQEGIWVLLRENVVLPGAVAKEEIRLQAALEKDDSPEAVYCQGTLRVHLYWQLGSLDHQLLPCKGKAAMKRRSFLSEPLDGGKPALMMQSKPFGISRFKGCTWQGEPIMCSKAGWRLTALEIPWKAGRQPDIEMCRAELICLHGVRTGLRTVLLEALLKIPYKEDLFEQWPGKIWLKQEELIIELEDDAVMEVLGVSFHDGMMQMGYNRDTRCLQLEWLCQITIFYLRAPSGGGRIGAATVSQKKSAILPTLKDFKQEMPSFRPTRQDVVVRIHKPERLLCRFGLFLKARGENLS